MIRSLVCFHLIFALVLGPNVCCCAVHELLGGSAVGSEASPAHDRHEQISQPQLESSSSLVSQKPCCQAQKRLATPVVAKTTATQAQPVSCCHLQERSACHCSQSAAVFGGREANGNGQQDVVPRSVQPISWEGLCLGGNSLLLPRHGRSSFASLAALHSDQPGRTWAVLLNRWTC